MVDDVVFEVFSVIPRKSRPKSLFEVIVHDRAAQGDNVGLSQFALERRDVLLRHVGVRVDGRTGRRVPRLLVFGDERLFPLYVFVVVMGRDLEPIDGPLSGALHQFNPLSHLRASG